MTTPDTTPIFRSGFVALLGRPNVGKSSIVNAVCGRKISIVSDKPQTTRHRVMGVHTLPDAQIVFVDTPGLHKAVSALGEKVNATALGSTDGVDVPCLVLDATKAYGKGDQWVAAQLDMPRAVVIVNKIDVASKNQVMAMLGKAGALDAEAYFPVSAHSGEGIDALVAHLAARLPEGPKYFPDDEFTDMPEEQWVAELVREQLLAVTRDELPYSIATRVTEWEWPRIRVDIIVERPGQNSTLMVGVDDELRDVGSRGRVEAPAVEILSPARQLRGIGPDVPQRRHTGGEQFMTRSSSAEPLAI